MVTELNETQRSDLDMTLAGTWRRFLRTHFAALAILAGVTTAAFAQSYPTRPIRLIVPFAAGGANDIVARLIQPDLEKALGQPIIIENKPAATGIVGTDLLGTVAGEVQFTVMSPLASLAQINAGALRAIASGSAARDPHFPDLPTVAESGFPGFEAVAWVGMFTTAGTPAAIVDRLNAEVNRIIRGPAIAAKFDEQGLTPAGGTPAAFGAFIAQELRRWKDAARAANVAAE
jgi:tripartite-type tricarboxylate transporter receptor subunit TctC